MDINQTTNEELQKLIDRLVKKLPRPERIIKLSEVAESRLKEATNNVWWRKGESAMGLTLFEMKTLITTDLKVTVGTEISTAN